MKRILASVALLIAAHAHGEDVWEFDVFLDDKPIGSHTFEVERTGGRTVLTSEADFKVKFLFVTAFEYEHRNKEVWVDGCLAEIDATTNNNGERLVVEGERDESSFEVSGKNGPQELEGCVRTFAYWNPSILGASNLLNAQTGEYESVSAELVGEEVLQVEGQDVAVNRYRLSAKQGDLMVSYTKDNQRWVALDAPTKGGDRRIRYRASRVPRVEASVVARSYQ